MKMSKEMIAILALAFTMASATVAAAVKWGEMSQRVVGLEVHYAKIDQKLDKVYELLLDMKE
jgi:hypothetical protein